MKTCWKCNNENKDEDNYCSKCGANLDRAGKPKKISPFFIIAGLVIPIFIFVILFSVIGFTIFSARSGIINDIAAIFFPAKTNEIISVEPQLPHPCPTQITCQICDPCIACAPCPKSKTVIVTETALAPLPDFVNVYNFNGSGSQSTDIFELKRGTIKIKWEYTGDSIFMIGLVKYPDGKKHLITSVSGKDEGQKIFVLEEGDRYHLDIAAIKGDWNITIDRLP